MKIQMSILVIALITLISACQKSEQNGGKTNETAATSSTSNLKTPLLEKRNPASYNSAKVMGENSEQPNNTASVAITDYTKPVDQSEFVRSASINASVTDALKTAMEIEDIAIAMNGYVAVSNLETTHKILENSRTDMDSITTFKELNSNCKVTIKIPNYYFDATLSQITNGLENISKRNITANDVRIAQLSNELNKNIAKKNIEQLEKIIEQSKDPIENKIEAEKKWVQMQREKNSYIIANEGLKNQIEYSQIQLDINQLPSIVYHKSYSPLPIPSYHEPFYVSITKAIKQGYYAFEKLLVFLIGKWHIWILFIGIVLLLKKYIPYMLKHKLLD